MQRQRLVIVGLVVVVVAAMLGGCSSLLGADPTPVPGAAATLTRSSRTPIPTPARTSAPSPGVSGAASRFAAGASPAPSASVTSQGAAADDIEQLRRRMERAVGGADLPGMDELLLDHVSLSSALGGTVMDAVEAAAWLRDHAGAGISVTGLEQATQSPMLQVQTTGWQHKDPIEHGQVTFSLRRYDANGKLDEDRGDWKIDVIEAD